jgi:hypothetical protein
MLKVAVRGNDIELARFLLNEGANPMRIDKVTRGDSPAAMQELLHAADIIHRLYPRRTDSAAAAEGTDLDKALISFDLAKARQLLDKEKGSPLAPDIALWQMYGGQDDARHDVKCALLVLGATDDIERIAEAGSDEKSLMHHGMRRLKETNPALYSYLRTFPYRSEKQAEPVMLNGLAKFDGTNKSIVCIDLATAWVLQRMALNNKSDYSMFAGVDEIQTWIKPEIRSVYDRLIAHATQNHLKKNSEFGQFAVEKLRAMEAVPMEGNEKDRAIHMLIETTEHTMSAELKLKFKADGGKSYVVNFYDPNSTVGDKRVEVDNLEDLRRLNLEALLPTKHHASTYYGNKEEDHISMIHIISPDALSNTSVPGGDITTRLNSRCEGLNPKVLFHLLRRGYADDLRALKQRLVAHLDTLTRANQIAFLAAKTKSGDSACFYGLQNGQAKAVGLLCEIVLQSKLNASDKVELLSAARKYDRATGLELAFQKGHTETIETFCDAIIASNLPPRHKFALLSGDPPEVHLHEAGLSPSPSAPKNRSAGLFYGFQEGHSEAVAAYCRRLLGSDLSNADKVELLSPELEDGFPGLGAPLINAHVETIKAFGKALKESDLPVEDKLKIFSAARNDGQPSLLSGQKPDTATIEAYRVAAESIGIGDQKAIRDILAAWN